MLILERREGTSIRIGDNVSVSVRSVEGKAAKLAIKAPRQVCVVREELLEKQWTASLEDSPKNPRTSPVDKSTFGIVMIEDDPIHAELIQYALKSNGYSKTTLHTTGKDAIAALGDIGDAEPPSLILLDYQLPDLSGLEVLKALRQVDSLRRTPIVMLSSSREEEHVRSCSDAGANAFVEKSPSFEEMEESLWMLTNFWAHNRVAM